MVVSMCFDRRDNAGGQRRELRSIGSLLAAKTNVLPSILAYADENRKAERRSGSTFVKRSSATQCALYEPEHGLGGVVSCSRISTRSGRV